MKQKTRNSTLAISIFLLALIGCDYDVPITAEPTRKIDATVLRDWTSIEWTNADCKDRMKVRRYDDVTYIISYNGDLYRAWHSDVAGTPFVTVQQLDAPERKYHYFTWSLSDGGKRLALRSVNPDLVPKETRDSATIVKILRENLENPELLKDAGHFR